MRLQQNLNAFTPKWVFFFLKRFPKALNIACSGGCRERRDKGLGGAEFTGTKQQVNQTKPKECQ